jgi:hypothetical protein
VGTASASSRSFSDSGLAPGTPYSYTVAAETAGGISPQSATTGAQTRQQTLAAPSNLQAVEQDNLSVLLTWQDNASGETGYLVERKLPATTEFVLTAMLPAGATSFADPPAALAEGGVEYRVRAYTATDESPPAYAYVQYVEARHYRVLLPLTMRK